MDLRAGVFPMGTWARLVIAISITIALAACAIGRVPLGEQVAIPTEAAAIAAARNAWISMHPELRGRIGSLEEWRKTSHATLEGDVWTVAPELPPNVIGGGVVTRLSRRSGRVTEQYITQ